MRQKVEIEVDVPAGWKPTGEFRRARKGDRYLATSGDFTWTSDVASSEKYIILERIEPKRESRWVGVDCIPSGWDCRDGCVDAINKIGGMALERRDYEDGKLVAVTLEPEGEEA